MDRGEWKRVPLVLLAIEIINEVISWVKLRDRESSLRNQKTCNIKSNYNYIYFFKVLEETGSLKSEEMLELLTRMIFALSSICSQPQKLHGIIYEWAKTKIVSGTSKDWNKACELLKFDDSIADVNLSIDPSDFPLQKTKDTKT